MKIPENFWFCGILRGYKMRTLTRNGLICSITITLRYGGLIGAMKFGLRNSQFSPSGAPQIIILMEVRKCKLFDGIPEDCDAMHSLEKY